MYVCTVYTYLSTTVLDLSAGGGDELVDGGSEDAIASVEDGHQTQDYGPVVMGETPLQVPPLCACSVRLR